MTYSKNRVDKAGKLLVAQFQVTDDRIEFTHKNSASEIEDAIGVIDWWRDEHRKPLSRVAANLFPYVAELGTPVVAQRLKRVPTIAGKLLRQPTMKVSRMEDIGGVRAILPSQDAAYRVARQLRKNWTITRFRDYVESPKADGYRALHLVNRNGGRLIEIQLRTMRQDVWANDVELFNNRFQGFKFGKGPDILHAYFKSMARYLAMDDQGIEKDDAFLGNFKALRIQASTFLKEHS